MATIFACGHMKKGQLTYDHTFANDSHKTIGQVGDTLVNHDLGIKFVIAAVELSGPSGQKARYTPAEGTLEVIGPDAAAEEERIDGSVPRLPGGRFE